MVNILSCTAVSQCVESASHLKLAATSSYKNQWHPKLAFCEFNWENVGNAKWIQNRKRERTKLENGTYFPLNNINNHYFWQFAQYVILAISLWIIQYFNKTIIWLFPLSYDSLQIRPKSSISAWAASRAIMRNKISSNSGVCQL